jgi:hypothetical protein
MKHINKFKLFNEAFLQEDKKKAIDIIVSYITKNSNVDLYEYEEIWHIQKKDLFLSGQLFVSLRSSKAIRFNWIEDDIRSEIHSIDIWTSFKFDENPEYTLELEQNSITKVLPQILNFVKDPAVLVKEELDIESDEVGGLAHAGGRVGRGDEQRRGHGGPPRATRWEGVRPAPRSVGGGPRWWCATRRSRRSR